LKRFLFTLLTILSSTVCLAETGPEVNSHSHSVIMKSISFEPKNLKIQAGDSVTWSNASYTDHSATGDVSKSFDTGLVPPKKASQAILFKEPGTFPYHCSVHGATMSAVVTVVKSEARP
jgi:plastocyanin